MTNPRHVCKPIVWATLLICASLFLVDSTALAQTLSKTDAALSDKERGIELYQQGNDLEAVAALRRAVQQDQNDLRAWHYLGLALGRQGKLNEARKAHEKAVNLGEKLIAQEYENPTPDISSQRLPQLIPLINEAADSADRYLESLAKPPQKKVIKVGKLDVVTYVAAKPPQQAAVWRERAELLREFSWWAEHANVGTSAKIFSVKEVTTKARIVSKPEPQYTEDARQKGEAGAVVLRAVFAADGKVRAIRIIKGLPNGLTMAAVKAARAIKFIPATLNGVPVSQYIQMEYYFSVY